MPHRSLDGWLGNCSAKCFPDNWLQCSAMRGAFFTLFGPNPQLPFPFPSAEWAKCRYVWKEEPPPSPPLFAVTRHREKGPPPTDTIWEFATMVSPLPPPPNISNRGCNRRSFRVANISCLLFWNSFLNQIFCPNSEESVG